MARYAVDPDESRLSLRIEGLTFLYHRPSRSTHVLDSPAPELIAALADGPADAATLLDRLARDHAINLTDADAAVAAVAARLEELAAAGLVRRVTAEPA